VLLTLTPLLLFSQDDTNKVVLDFDIAKLIALDLEEFDRLVVVDSINKIEIKNLNSQVGLLESAYSDKSSQIGLLSNTIQILNSQLEAEKLNKPKSNWFTWALAVIAAGGLGFVIGSF
jgi:hypothetical protein